MHAFLFLAFPLKHGVSEMINKTIFNTYEYNSFIFLEKVI